MIERLEVTAGPGTVIRYGYLVAWASASASANLISFLTESARNLATSPTSGDQIADHLDGVLQRRDPEPHVPFVVVGPSRDGWVGLLHGPVQVWDGYRWTAASPHPGWLRTPLSPSPALSVSVSGAPAPAVSPDSMLDLETGVVPGGGFILVPAVPSVVAGAVPRPFAPSIPLEDEATAVITPTETGPPTAAMTAEEGEKVPGEGEAADLGIAVGALAGAAHAPGAGPAGVVDLRSPQVQARIVAYPPLPPGGDPPRTVPGAPVVAGVPCPRGHLNRPGMSVCARCGNPIGVQGGYRVTGTRPALGCIITDRGSVYRLDTGYLVGSDPARDPTVRGRLARALALVGDEVAPSHAEIRLQDWEVVVTDRASAGGTHVFEPGAGAWQRLRAYEPRVLRPGTHLAFGQRVVTFITPWTPQAGGGASDQETSARY